MTLPQTIQLITPAKITETKALHEKTGKPKAHDRSPRTNSPPPSERKRIQDMEKQIDKLQRKNAYLHKKIAALTAEKRAAASKIADNQSRNPDVPYDTLLAAYDLPKKTTVSTGGWKKEMPIIYSQERDAFCDRFQKKYTEEEKGRFAKAIRLLAQEGAQRSHNSLETKMLRRELPGMPRDANYSRASHELRFTWEQVGDVLRILNAYKHKSGHAHSLSSVK